MRRPYSELINKVEEYLREEFKFSFKVIINHDSEKSVEHNLVYGEIKALAKGEYADFKSDSLCYPKMQYRTKLLEVTDVINFLLKCDTYAKITKAKTKEITLTKNELKERIDNRITDEVFDSIYDGKTMIELSDITINLANVNHNSDCEFDESDPFDYSRSYDSTTFYYKIDFSASAEKPSDREELYTIENPYYGSPYDLIKHKFGKDFNLISRGFLNSLFIILPRDHVGKIELDLQENNLDVNVLREISDKLILKLQLKNEKLEKITHYDIKIGKTTKKETIKLEFIPDEIKGILIDSKNQVVQKIVEIPDIIQAGILTPDYIRSIIFDGEGLQTEFKWKYPRKQNNELEINVIRRNICAFANNEGGIILFGVDDEAEIKGYHPEKEFKTLNDFDAHIQTICNEDLEPPVIASIRDFELDGKSIVLVKIEKSKQLYVRVKKSKEIYFRKGSTSRKSKPFDLIKPADKTKTMYI